MNINTKNYLDLIRGASLVTTGGGIPLADQLMSIKKLKKMDIKLQTLAEFPKDAFICLTAELGPTDVPPLNKQNVIKQMLNLLEQASGRKISGIYPPEMGQESVVMEAAHFLNLPVADFDPVGFRAVPYIDINIFNLKGINVSYTPMVISTDRNETFLLNSSVSYDRLEDILRQMTQLSQRRSIFLLGAVLKVADLVKNFVEGGSYSRATQLGRMKTEEELINSLRPKLIKPTTVISKKEIEVKGFFAEIVKLKTDKKKTLKMIVLNEVLCLVEGQDKIIASVPDKILLIDRLKLSGISTTLLSQNTKVLILVVDPESDWRNARARQLFGVKRFEKLIEEVSHD